MAQCEEVYQLALGDFVNTGICQSELTLLFRVL